MSATYTTMQDVHREIIAAIDNGDATAAEFDIDAIAANCWQYDTTTQTFIPTADEQEFWAQVEAAALTDLTAIVSPGDHPTLTNITVYGFQGWEVESWEASVSDTLEDIFSTKGYGVTRVDGETITIHRQD